ncbi:hypothetical protein ACRQ5D_09060 [Mucilaginibacter sp. P25]|uniref:Uncharacterized protein n=1 Tax=Mucilaginibacter gossypii TaxID=551996 RepID=A0A1G8HT57_9SPHI|nr:hypothetical protein [Mucilaginibacter gossypii]SDI09838.1 hypothetical protein SAMN05192573_11623 [Mucilaginibacter gossypii]
MPNIKFNYLYRDGGNYKNFNSIVFNNPQNILLPALEELIRSKLISQHWFYADQWQVADLHFDSWDNELDHTFHEFESVEYTNEAADSGMDLASFMCILQTVANIT